MALLKGATKKDITVSILRNTRSPHIRTVLFDKDIIDWVESQILKWGNIQQKDGCVYGVESNDEFVKVKARIVFNLYNCTKIDGYDSLFLNDKNPICSTKQEQIILKYIKKHKIKITSTAFKGCIQ